MIEFTSTIDLGEVLWVLAALPGFWFWVRNRMEAGLDYKAAETIVPRNGRYLWARFSVFLTNVLVGIEILFLALGGLAMLRVPPGGPHPELRWVTIGGLILASAVITLLAIRWQQVNAEIVRAARDRHPPHERTLPPDSSPEDSDTGGHQLHR